MKQFDAASGREDVRLLAAELNAQCAHWAKALLPNGRQAGRFWETSSIDDRKTGRYSFKLDMDGPHRGQWTDFGRAKGSPGYSGDILTLIAHVKCGGVLADAIAWAKAQLGWSSRNPQEFERARRQMEAQALAADVGAEEERAKRRGRARALWHGAVPIVETPAISYLASRGISFEALGKVPGALRYRPDVWCTEAAAKDGRNNAKLPAMVCAIFGLDGEIIGAHRHYLDIAGWSHATRSGPVRKAALDEAKKSFGPSLGGHIPLWKGQHRHPLREIPAGTRVYMSEGVEDGLSVAVARPELRVIAGVSLSKMGRVDLPEQIGALVIIGQNDPQDSEAVAALELAIAAQQARGHVVETIFPPPEYKDFNDMLCGKVKS